MIKRELAIKVARRLKLTNYEAERFIDTVIFEMKHAIDAGDEITLRGFGTLSTTVRRAKVGRLLKGPSAKGKTVEPLIIPAKRIVKFKQADSFKIKQP